MRSICAVVTLGALLSSAPASADYAKAWQAAKDNLPSTTQMALVVDVAAIAKLPSFTRVFEALRGQERDFEMGYTLLKGACNVTDPVAWVDGVVLAGDTRGKDNGVGFVQVTIDRTKASACLESVLKVVGGRKTTSVKQDGIYTVATVGKDTAYFAWVTPNVIAFSIRPDNKASLDAFLNQKGGWVKAPVAALATKMDPKAVLSGVFAVDKVDTWFPVAKAFANVTLSGGTITGAVTGSFLDAKAATSFAEEMNKERDRDLKKDRTPAAVKKLMTAVKIAAGGTEVTAKGSLSEKDFGDAIIASFQKKKSGGNTIDQQAILKEMEGFTTKMCACKDKACADKVVADMTAWGTDLAKRGPAMSEKPDPDIAKKSADTMTRFTDCMTKVMTSKN